MLLNHTEQRAGVADEPAALWSGSWKSICRFVVLLAVLSVVTWRHKVYYTGGVDPVVAAKALLGGIALVAAWVAGALSGRPHRIGSKSIWILLAYVGVSTFGAWSAGHLAASGVLSVRLLIVGFTMLLLMRAFPAQQVLRDLMVVMLTVGLVGAATGIGTYISGGRLQGGLPPLNPNEISMLLGVPALGLVWLALNGRGRWRHGAMLVAILVVIWATGSRTGLLALIVAIGLMFLLARRLRPLLAFTVVCALPLLLYLALGTDLLQGYFDRSGSNVLTLNSRTIAWTAALKFPETEWIRWMGSGLVQKQISVAGQYWDEQVLDSSWVSALVQAGLLGAALLLVWCATTSISALRCARPPRMMFVGLLAFLLIRSVLESGLMDSTPAFMTFFCVSLLADRTSASGTASSSRSRADENISAMVRRALQ